jgi:peptidoglycan/LPS O-acetylase OafA/YrhL
LLWLGASIGYVAAFDPGWARLGPREIAENLALFPLMWGAFDLRPWLTGVRYIGPTWSLSLEFYFYLLLPVLIFRRGFRILATVCSLGIFLIASLDIIEPTVWGYRFLPGVLFIFLIGSEMWDKRKLPIAPMLTVLAVAIAAWFAGTLGKHWTLELVLGVLGGGLLVFGLSWLAPRPLDTLAGNISYGVFLNHSLILGIIWRRYPHLSGRTVFVYAAAASILAAAAGHWVVERPLQKWRRRLKSRPGSEGAAVVSGTAGIASAR